jgi:hypothetical protein
MKCLAKTHDVKVMCVLTKSGFTCSPFHKYTHSFQTNAKKEALTIFMNPESLKFQIQEGPNMMRGQKQVCISVLVNHHMTNFNEYHRSDQNAPCNLEPRRWP